jgi:hypothetical protein
MSAGNPGQRAEPIDEATCHAPRAGATAEHERQQLLVLAGLGAEALEA